MRNIGFIGGGNMAQSLIKGLIDAGHDRARLAASDPDARCRDRISALGAKATADNQRAVDFAHVAVLATKPQVLAEVLAGISAPEDMLLVSICAGAPAAGIAALTSPAQPIVRCMPNTPALLGAGVTALYPNANVDAAGRQAAEEILGTVSKTLWVDDEAALDAVTAVSGSGPAYFFYLMEAMVEAGTKLGLAPELATTLTVETAWGAVRMVRETGLPPATLRRNVTSPQGTTESAIRALNRHEVGRHIVAALDSASRRSRELGEEFTRK